MVRLAILGFGLIGGSIARALATRDPGGWRVSAWSRSPAAPERALREGIVADVPGELLAACADAHLVLLAASPAANVDLVARVGPAIAVAGQLLTDVTGVQRPVAVAAGRVPGLRFVGGHPLSGRETRGYGAASPDLFVDRPWAILPGPAASAADVDLVRRLALACGALPVELDATAHDRAVATISHLPLLAAVALVEAAAALPGSDLAVRLAAGGWRDATRLARGDPELGAGMLALNADLAGEALRGYRARLEAWQERLAGIVASADPGAAVEALAAELAAVAARAAPPPPEPS
ncbi:MAG: prephenate dehydrogenase [Candidatus Limnocylindrales bacterium]